MIQTLDALNSLPDELDGSQSNIPSLAELGITGMVLN